MNNRDNLFNSALGSVQLERYPLERNTPLRAWNAADELALTYFKEQTEMGRFDASQQDLRVLTINDQNGALAIPLSQFLSQNNQHSNEVSIHCWSDSSLSQHSIASNFKHNLSDSSAPTPIFIASTSPLEGLYDAVFIQVPKTLSLLEHQLRHLRECLHPNSLIIGCGMVKHLRHSYTELFEKLIGNTHTSLAKKKARLILPSFSPSLTLPPAPAPKQYSLEEWPITLTNLSNVFAQNNLDIGTRFFLPHLGADQPHINSIFDLGCGNGALGIAAGLSNPTASLGFYDDSFLAVASANLSFSSNNIGNPACFKAMDCLSEETQSADLILCNPPFHQSNTVGTQVALRMFQQAKQHLNKQGELRVIGNRHLNYHISLKKLFKNTKILDRNKKFDIFLAKN